MAVTNTQVYLEIANTLIETPSDGSTDPTSGLYTRSYIEKAYNNRLNEFIEKTGVYAKYNQTVAATSGTREVATPTDVIDILEISFVSPTNGQTVIPKGSLFEADTFVTDLSTSADTPTIYTIDTGPVQTISLVPPPNSTNNVVYAYVAQQTGPSFSPPDGTALTIQDDFTPFIKYGTLANIFGKSGEVYDPMRQSICNDLFELGVLITRDWVSGADNA